MATSTLEQEQQERTDQELTERMKREVTLATSTAEKDVDEYIRHVRTTIERSYADRRRHSFLAWFSLAKWFGQSCSDTPPPASRP
jgi:hypothetical protein